MSVLTRCETVSNTSRRWCAARVSSCRFIERRNGVPPARRMTTLRTHRVRPPTAPSTIRTHILPLHQRYRTSSPKLWGPAHGLRVPTSSQSGPRSRDLSRRFGSHPTLHLRPLGICRRVCEVEGRRVSPLQPLPARITSAPQRPRGRPHRRHHDHIAGLDRDLDTGRGILRRKTRRLWATRRRAMAEPRA